MLPTQHDGLIERLFTLITNRFHQKEDVLWKDILFKMGKHHISSNPSSYTLLGKLYAVDSNLNPLM